MKANSITFSKRELGDNLWNTVNSQIQILLSSGYEVFIRMEENDIIIVEYAYDANTHSDWGADRFFYVTAEEEEEIYYKRQFSVENSN